MKVGFARFNNDIELDYMSSSITLRGTENRLGMLEAMVDDGHEVDILTQIRDEDQDLVGGASQDTFAEFGGSGSTGEIDYDFLEEVGYRPEDRDIEDIDVLYIECGPPNTLFGYKPRDPEYRQRFDGDVPYIWRVFDLIDNHSGHVVYCQHDIKLGFPFKEATREPTEGVVNRNLTKMGSEVDFWEDKEWTIWTSTLNPERLEEYYQLNRYSYHEYPISYCVVPTAYSENIDLRFEQQPREDQDHDLIYIGAGDRSEYRREKIEEYFSLPDWDVGIVGGKWDDHKFPDAQFHGHVGSHGDVYEIQNWGMSSVIVGCELFEESEMMAPRVCATLRGGNVAMVDSDLGTGYYIDEDWHVGSKGEVEENLEYLSELSLDERREINQRQLDNLNRWVDYDWTEILTHEEGTKFIEA